MKHPTDIHNYRDTTNKSHRKMPGIKIPSFRCAKCKKTKNAAGRKQAVKGTTKFGYYCAECAAELANAHP